MLRKKVADRARPRAVKELAGNLDANVKPHFGAARDVRTIRRIDLEAFKQKLHGEGSAPTTINNNLTAIRQVLKYACEVEELIESVPLVKNVPVPRESTVAMPLSPEQAERFLAAFKPDEIEEREFNQFLLNTGLRRAEALAIRWDWVDWQAREISIPAEVRKGGKPQRAPTEITPTVYALLRARQRRQVQPSKGRVFFQLKGGRKGARDYDKARRAAAKRAGIEGYRHHDARHTRATLLGAAGATGTDLRDQMGWSTLAMVSRYTHPEKARMREMAGRVQIGVTGSGDGRKKSHRGDRTTSADRGKRGSRR